MNKKIVLGMSGGVDSSASAFLLKRAGYDVLGVTFKFWTDDNYDNEQAVADAKKVCEKLSIEHMNADFTQLFSDIVIQNFISEYENGKTPNPCVICNRHLKFNALLKVADSFGIENIATGHYANITKLENGRYTFIRDENSKKDQTYALYNLTQEQLKRVVMPLYKMEKAAVRQIAKDIGLDVFDKPDSQEICFIPDNDYIGFLKSKGVLSKPGDFIDENGAVLGNHSGVINYTVGQRKGLGIAFGEPKYVKKIDKSNNSVTLSSNEALFSKSMTVKDINFMGMERFDGEIELIGKVRYAHNGACCVVRMDGEDRLICEFSEPQRAITPGQSAVFFKDNALMFGGVIE